MSSSRVLPASGLPSKTVGKVLQRLLLPGIDHGLMHAVLGAKLRDRQLATDRFECYFRFEFYAARLRVTLLISARPFSGRAKLN